MLTIFYLQDQFETANLATTLLFLYLVSSYPKTIWGSTKRFETLLLQNLCSRRGFVTKNREFRLILSCGITEAVPMGSLSTFFLLYMYINLRRFSSTLNEWLLCCSHYCSLEKNIVYYFYWQYKFRTSVNDIFILNFINTGNTVSHQHSSSMKASQQYASNTLLLTLIHVHFLAVRRY